MENLFAKCGCNCGRCPSYRENLRTDEDRQRCSDGWKKYIGFRLNPDKLRLCDGCQVPDDENPTRYQSCYVRKCAIRNGVATCAHCSGYPCEDVPRVSLAADAREKAATRLGTPIPEQDYLVFIEPYEGIKHLDEIRASLGPGDIVEMTKPSPVRTRLVGFPGGLTLSEEETAAFKALYRLLAAIRSAPAETYARQALIRRRMQHMLKIMWAFGRFGEFAEEGGSHLVIDGKTCGARAEFKSIVRKRDNALHGTAAQCFGILREHGVRGEHVPLGKGWLLKMSFDDEAGGAPALKALKSYAAKLEEYGEEAFKRFSKADMRVLSSDS